MTKKKYYGAYYNAYTKQNYSLKAYIKCDIKLGLTA